MSRDELYLLMEKTEDEHIEFKKAEFNFDTGKLMDYCAALANERGGKLILGITDKKPRKIIGTKAFQNKIEKTKEQLLQKIPLRIEIEELYPPEGRVLVFHIPSRPIGVPIQIDGRYLMRIGGALTAMSADMLKNIFDESGPDFSNEVCKKISMSDLEIDAIEDFRKRWIKKSGNESIKNLKDEQLLIDAELLVDGRITYAALILFGKQKSLGKYLGQSEVIFEYRPNESSGPPQQRVEFRRGFFTFYDELWKLIDLRNTNQHYQEGLFIWDIKTFNESAIREMILNSVCHRDYRYGRFRFHPTISG